MRDEIVAMVTRARDGDRLAFAQLVRRFQDFAVACACGRLRDPELSQDAAQEAAADTLGAMSTAYDSLWTGSGVPTQEPTALESVMLSNDKLYVVLAVVLIIWIGIMVMISRTDRHLARLERSVEEHIPETDDEL